MWNIRNITQEIPLTLGVHRKGRTFPHLRPPQSKPKDGGPTTTSVFPEVNAAIQFC